MFTCLRESPTTRPLPPRTGPGTTPGLCDGVSDSHSRGGPEAGAVTQGQEPFEVRSTGRLQTWTSDPGARGAGRPVEETTPHWQ